MKRLVLSAAAGLVLLVAINGAAQAHGPLFSPAPETIFKGGTQLTLGFDRQRASGAGETVTQSDGVLEADYGLTADWEIGFRTPYSWRRRNQADANGLGDVTLDSKYQFWKRDLRAAQYKAAALVKLKLPSGDDGSRPPLGSGSVDLSAGLVAGYESRRWYWFASGVYRANREGAGSLKRGDRQFLNLVGGVRPVLSGYKEPDTVLMLELNFENAARDDLNGLARANSGGWQLFLSPVVWWTYRQLAVRAGVQLGVARDLNGTQPSSDYRSRIELVYHF